MTTTDRKTTNRPSTKIEELLAMDEDTRNRELRLMADDALGEALRRLQNDLGVSDGGFAGSWFDGDEGETIVSLLVEYARAQLEEVRPGTHPERLGKIEKLHRVLNMFVDNPVHVEFDGKAVQSVLHWDGSWVDPDIHYGTALVDEWIHRAEGFIATRAATLSAVVFEMGVNRG